MAVYVEEQHLYECEDGQQRWLATHVINLEEVSSFPTVADAVENVIERMIVAVDRLNEKE